MAGVGGDKNIRVNCIRPGQIMTPGATRGTINDPDGGHHVFESMFDLTQIIPGPGYPRDVANLVLFLIQYIHKEVEWRYQIDWFDYKQILN